MEQKKKICAKCLCEKQLNEFGNRKNSKDGYRNQCKLCEKIKREEYKQNNPEKIKNIIKNWRKNNPEKIKQYNKKRIRKPLTKDQKNKLKEYNKQKYKDNSEMLRKKSIDYYHNNPEKVKKYRETNKEKINKRIRKWAKVNSEKINENAKKYRKNNPEKIKKSLKKYRDKNRKKECERSIIYQKNKRLNDPLFKLMDNLRKTVYKALTKGGYSKTSKTNEILGCAYEEFKIHIENQWILPKNLNENGDVWMNWNNYGNPKDGILEPNKTWDIDHIKPLGNTKNKTKEEIIKLNHYTNLQPLCSYVNRYIKKDKI